MSRRPWGLDAPDRYGARGGGGGNLPRRSLVVALVLAALSLMLLDRGGTPVADPARAVLGEVFGPAQDGAAAAVRPVVQLPDYLRSRSDVDHQIASLTAENQQLKTQVRKTDYDRNRIAELDGLTGQAKDLGYALVPAHVVGVGASQSFSDTVTIDAGSDAGLRPDLTVVSGDGLVGRVLRVSGGTATVLLAIDSDSTIGARIGQTMEVGFLHGRGELGDQARLDLDLIDQSAVPARHDTVLTWGSQGTGPYVSGVPIGEVTSVYRSLRDSAQRVQVKPFVDFSALDLVGVVVPTGTDAGSHAIIEADGSLR